MIQLIHIYYVRTKVSFTLRYIFESDSIIRYFLHIDLSVRESAGDPLWSDARIIFILRHRIVMVGACSVSNCIVTAIYLLLHAAAPPRRLVQVAKEGVRTDAPACKAIRLLEL